VGLSFVKVFVDLFCTVLTVAIFIRAILSFFPNVPQDHPLVTALLGITDPVLVPLRRIVPLIGGLDLSPMLAIIMLQLIQRSVAGIAV
jgi:YggT family protein